jgi:hypothetical protein
VCELYLRARNIGLAAEPELSLPLSQVMMADALGMTPVHINRVLKELRVAGAMTLQRGSLIISDPEKLVRIAGFDENYLHRRLRLQSEKGAVHAQPGPRGSTERRSNPDNHS